MSTPLLTTMLCSINNIQSPSPSEPPSVFAPENVSIATVLPLPFVEAATLMLPMAALSPATLLGSPVRVSEKADCKRVVSTALVNVT